jgi:putative oxidoreductase
MSQFGDTGIPLHGYTAPLPFGADLMTRTNADLGRLLLRLALGGLILFHGVAKLTGGIDPIAGMVTAMGLPAFVAYGVYVGEVVAPVLLIVGWFSRIAALLIATNMVFALALAHRADLFKLGPSGGYALELQALYLIAAIALVLMGPGRYSMNER